MATLEKIRSKSVLLLVIIGVALIAFIIGDFFTSGRFLFGRGTTVAKADGEKVEIQDYSRRLENASQAAQQQLDQLRLQDPDTKEKVNNALIQQQVLVQMIDEKLLAKEYDKLGIKVTDNELSNIMVGENAVIFYSWLNSIMQGQLQPEFIVNYYDMATNPQKYGIDANQADQMLAQWQEWENMMEQWLLQQKFAQLLQGTLTANKLDAKAFYDDMLSIYNIEYALQEFSTLSDDKYPVSDAEINKEWEANKKLFETPEELRRISYIYVPITPSTEDRKQGEKDVEDALFALNSKNGLEGVTGDYKFKIKRNLYTPATLQDFQLRQFVDSTEAGNAALISRGDIEFELGKVLDKSNRVDSVNIDFFAIPGARVTADSIMLALNNGTLNIDSLAAKSEIVNLQIDQTIPMFIAGDVPEIVKQQFDQQIPVELRNTLLAAEEGIYLPVDTAATENIRVFRVNGKNEPIEVTEVAVIKYETQPSSATVNSMRYELQEYINKNSNAADFFKNGASKGVAKDLIGASSVGVGASNLVQPIFDTREAVVWAMQAKKGEVSPIYGGDDKFIVVAVDDIYKETIPASDPSARAKLIDDVRKNKKAADLIAQYKGKANDVEGYAQLMGTTSRSIGVNMRQSTPAIGAEGLGYVAASTPGKLVGPVQTENGVVVFILNDVDNMSRPYAFEENAQSFNATVGGVRFINPMLYYNPSVIFNESLLHQLLLGKKGMENNLGEFYQK